jgi:hypothetical protein
MWEFLVLKNKCTTNLFMLRTEIMLHMWLGGIVVDKYNY